MKFNRIPLGEFNQASSVMLATDPCYDEDTSKDIRGRLENVRPGKWNAFVLSGKYGSWGSRVVELQAYHESCSPEQGDNSIWMCMSEFHVGVDSGQAGLFDESTHPYGNLGEYDEEGSFYAKACAITIQTPFAGIVEGHGVVSSSGVGDGCYECYVVHGEDDTIVGVKIIFLETDQENSLEDL